MARDQARMPDPMREQESGSSKMDLVHYYDAYDQQY